MPATVSQNKKLDAFVDILIKKGWIESGDKVVFKEKNISTEEAFENLLSKKIVSEENLTRAYAELYGVSFIKPKAIAPSVLKTIPEALCRKYQIIPFDFKNKVLWIAVALPYRLKQGNFKVLEEIEGRSGVKIGIAFTTTEALTEAFVKKEPTAAPSNFPRISLVGKKIPRQALEKVHKEVAQKYGFVVFEIPQPDYIKIASVNPSNPKLAEIINFIKEKNKIKVEEYKTEQKDFDWAISLYDKESSTEKPVGSAPDLPKTEADANQPTAPTSSPSSRIESGDTTSQNGSLLEETWEESDLDKFLGKKITQLADIAAIAKDNSIPRIVAGLLSFAAHLEASDIHIEGGEKEVRIRFRIDGILRNIITLPTVLLPSIVARIKILSKLKIDEKRVPQDGRFDVKVGGHSIDLRISTLPTIFGEKVVMRLLDKSAGPLTLETLGLMGISYDRVASAIKKPFGLIFACGPTGSGKSTTLYALLSYLAVPKVNIITLEDPVEYELSGINQVQIKPQIGFTFATGLRSVLRQDPNIIMVGEVRDTETANLVTHAALTGHLVLTTLHTNDAAGALARIINMGVEPFLITSSINCVIGQRLVRRLCNHCKVPAQIPEATLYSIKKELEEINVNEPLKFYKGKGCPECSEGYRGRSGIYEVLEMSGEIEALTVSRASSKVIHNKAVKEGMITMRQDGLMKALKGITTIDEILRATME